MLTPHVRAIGRPAGPAQDDAVDSARVEGTPAALKGDLIQLIGKDQVLHRISDLVRYASDASPYRYLPQVVVLPRTIDDVRAILGYCARTGRHATFRAAGTSLNGQSQSDDILIDVRRHWAGLVVEDGGARLRARPGTILGQANAVLRRIGRRLGPDPASADVATIGGVIANNAGGMRCTLERNAYHTVSSLTLVLASGTVIDTAAPDAEAAFAAAEPELAAGLRQLREELLADEELAQRVRHKFAIRNTNGYALSALLDGETPLEIFRRLLIGSEGTLAFVAEAVIDTIPAPAMTTVSWVVLPSISQAAALVPGLVGLGAEAVELMLAPALAAAAQAFPGTPGYWRSLDPGAAALLVEFGADSPAGLDAAVAQVAGLVAGANLLHPLEFTRDEEQIELFWRVRDGLLGIVGQQRPDGTALVIEDVCFPPDRVAEGAQDLQELLSKHSFLPNTAGHAAYGNLHFTLTPRLADSRDRERYAAFMADLVTLVVDKYDGSLKAEHGTGINMAPFVRHEWGEKATDMMWRIKKLADPHGVLAPNVILTRDDGINLKSFKSTPPIEDVAAHCIECGFCEAVCPSRNITTTPRQRIVLRREMARQPEGSPLLARLQDDIRIRRHRDLRRGRQLCDPVPGPDQHRRAGEDVPPRRIDPAPGESRADDRPAVGDRGKARPDGGRRRRPHPAHHRRQGPDRPDRGRPACRQRRPHPVRPRPDAARPAARAALDHAGGRRRGVLPRLHQPHLRSRPGPGPAPVAAAGPGRGIGARRKAAVDSRRRRGQVLLHPVEQQGLPAGTQMDGRHHLRCAVGVERARHDAGGHRRGLLHERAAGRRQELPRRRAPRPARADHAAGLHRVVRRPVPGAHRQRARRKRRRPPDLLHHPPGADQDPRASRRPPRRGRPRAGRHDLLRHRR